MYAAATSSKSMTGIPTTVIQEVNEPTLTMWDIMGKRSIEPSPWMRDEAAQDDVFMILSNIRSACTIGLWNIVAKDMDQSAETIKEMRKWIKDTGLIKAFTGGQINSTDKGALYNWQVHGKYAIFCYRDGMAGGKGKPDRFVNIPVDGLRRFTHPTDPGKYYFFQKFKKESDWTDPENWDDVETLQEKGDVPSEEQIIWYIDGGEKNREAKDKDTGDPMYPNIKSKDWVNDLKDLYYIENPTPPLNANVITTIMNKRYLVMMTTAAVQLGIAPLIKITHGNDTIRPPPAADEKIKTVNAAEYAKQQAMVDTFTANMQTTADTVHVAVMNGKPVSVQYGVDIDRDEPHMALTSDFMEKVIAIYNNIIARAVGLPLSLIESSGTELATSQVVKSQNDLCMMATQLGFNDVLTELLALEFEKQIEDEEIMIELQPLDRASSKTRAEIQKLLASATLSLYHSGATPDTLENFILGNEDMPLRKADMSAVRDSLPETDETNEKDDNSTRVPPKEGQV